MVVENRFDNDLIDIFDCDIDHSTSSYHFKRWIGRAAFGLRKKIWPSRRIWIIIDNTTWRNELTDSTNLP